MPAWHVERRRCRVDAAVRRPGRVAEVVDGVPGRVAEVVVGDGPGGARLGPEVDQVDVVGVVLALVVFVIVWACNCRLRFLVKSLKIVSITDLSFTSLVG